MRLSNKIVFASLNHHKYLEFRSLFSAYPGIELIPAENIVRNADRLGTVEKFDTYLENAAAKARLANSACHYPCLADDTGLEIAALDGRPGVRTRRYAPPKAGVSQDQANVEKVLEELKGRPMALRSARFVCTLALVVEGILSHATGVLDGAIAEAPQGKNGFGYDPIFIPKGYQKTLAEMSDAEKNSISHRALAMHELMVQVKAKGIILARP